MSQQSGGAQGGSDSFPYNCHFCILLKFPYSSCSQPNISDISLFIRRKKLKRLSQKENFANVLPPAKLKLLLATLQSGTILNCHDRSF